MPVASQHLDQRHPITSQPQPRERLAAALADRYRIERELGRGGMATVYLADDLRHDRKVAIKVLRPELAGAIGVDRFVREIRLTAQLQHPGIVTVFDSGVVPGPGTIELPWYAMPYIAGESLRARLEREGQLPVEDALRIAEEAAAALHAAHRQGVVHRDIKPENLLLADGRTHVADFGIAKALLETGGERLTSTGLAIGTPAYKKAYWAMHDLIFEHQQDGPGALSDAGLLRLAAAAGVDADGVSRDLESARFEAKVRADFMSGARSGVNGTPTFFINGVRHDGGWDDATLLAAIEEAAGQRSAI